MVNRPKRKGTAAETAVLRYAHGHGFPEAYRLALAGAADRGDLHLGCLPGVDGAPGLRLITEVKSTSGAVQLTRWVRELEAECGNWPDAASMVTRGLLVVKYRGVGDRSLHRWLAAMPAPWWAELCEPLVGRRLENLHQWPFTGQAGRFVDEVASMALCSETILADEVPWSIRRFQTMKGRVLVIGAFGEMLMTLGSSMQLRLDINAASMQH